MFYYLEGKVAHVEPYLAVIDCGGVGYACRTTNHTIRQLKKGEVKRLYTYLNVGDGIFELYGFATEQELNSFKLLIGVSGVGPKAALAILSVGTPEHLTMQFGPFTVDCSIFPHIPVPGMQTLPHAVYWISAAGKSVYVTADAQIDTARHRAILHGRRAEAAFWNGQYLSYPQTRALLAEVSDRNYVYHIPIDEKDVCGIRRKCERSMVRFSAELSTVKLLEAYPSEIVIE